MANIWLVNGSSYQTSATLGNVLSSTVKVVSKNVVWVNGGGGAGYWFSQAGSTGSTRELGIFSLNNNLTIYAGGEDTVIGNFSAIFGSNTLSA